MNGHRITFNEDAYASDLSEHEFLLGTYAAWVIFNIEVIHKWISKERRSM